MGKSSRKAKTSKYTNPVDKMANVILSYREKGQEFNFDKLYAKVFTKQFIGTYHQGYFRKFKPGVLRAIMMGAVARKLSTMNENPVNHKRQVSR